jgi:hypothetical protein
VPVKDWLLVKPTAPLCHVRCDVGEQNAILKQADSSRARNGRQSPPMQSIIREWGLLNSSLVCSEVIEIWVVTDMKHVDFMQDTDEDPRICKRRNLNTIKCSLMQP